MTTENPRRIIWEKWQDPLLAGVKDWKERLKNTPWEDAYSQLERPSQLGVYQGPMLASPAGFIPLNELNCPSRTFNLWIGHCSFILDRATLERIKGVLGVEVIHVWSPYRLWLGVGRAFEEDGVKKAVLAASIPVNERPAPAPPQPAEEPAAEIVVGLDLMREVAARKYTHWAVFVMANGKLDIAGSDSREDVESEIRLRSEKAKRVVTSWDEG